MSKWLINLGIYFMVSIAGYFLWEIANVNDIYLLIFFFGAALFYTGRRLEI